MEYEYDFWEFSDFCPPEKNNDVGKNPKRFTYEQKAILMKWFEENKQNPYVGKISMIILVKTTGLKEKQIRTYFTNLRIRNKNR